MSRKFWFKTIVKGLETFVNADHVVAFYPNDPDSTLIVTGNDAAVIAQEPYEAIKKQLEAAFAEGY